MRSRSLSLLVTIFLAFSGANGQSIRSYANFNAAAVDGQSGGGVNSVERSVSVSSADFTVGGLVEKVMIQLSYEKIDGGGSGNEAGKCLALGGPGHQGGQAHNKEIGFSLRSPNGSIVSLIKSDIPGPSTFNGNSYGGKVYQLFDDSAAASQNGRPKPQNGSVSPEEPFSSFIGQAPAGTWTLITEDSKETDPVCSSAFTLIIITDEDAPLNPDDDSDGDGIPNDTECPDPNMCSDTDTDGIPDYLDPDADNDGVPDTGSGTGGGSGDPGGDGTGGDTGLDEDGQCLDLRPIIDTVEQSAVDIQALLPEAFKVRKKVLSQISCPGAKAPTTKTYTAQVTASIDTLMNELMEITTSLAIEDEATCQSGACSLLDFISTKENLTKKLKLLSKGVKKNLHRLCLNAKSTEYIVPDTARKAIKAFRAKLKVPLKQGQDSLLLYPDAPMRCRPIPVS